MAAFFKNNFEDVRWRKAALKNAFSLLGKQKFQRAAAFFLLAGAVKDAIEVNYCFYAIYLAAFYSLYQLNLHCREG